MNIPLSKKSYGLSLLFILQIINLTAEENETWSEFEIAAELAQPVFIQSKTGLNTTGYITQVSPSKIVIETRAERGFVSYLLSKDEILQLKFPGENLRIYAEELIQSASPSQGLPLIDLLYEQRAPYLAYLPEAEAIFFAEMIPFYRQFQRPQKALTRAQSLKKWIQDPTTSQLLEAEILLGYYLLGERKRALELANQSITQDLQQADSALAWYVRSGLELQNEQFESAFFTALHPIVFSGAREMPYLEYCYAHAITAALQLDLTDQAQILKHEMEARALKWPHAIPAIDLNSKSSGQLNKASKP